mgnify:CR=1 FL=1
MPVRIVAAASAAVADDDDAAAADAADAAAAAAYLAATGDAAAAAAIDAAAAAAYLAATGGGDASAAYLAATADAADAAAADAADAAAGGSVIPGLPWYMRPRSVWSAARWHIVFGDSRPNPWLPLIEMWSLGTVPIGVVGGEYVIYVPGGCDGRSDQDALGAELMARFDGYHGECVKRLMEVANASARYVASHRLQAVRLQGAEDKSEYVAAAKALDEALVELHGASEKR